MSSEDEQKPIDMDAIIEAKRQRLAGKSSSARHAAEKKAEEARAESARQAQPAQPKVRKEFIHERLAREHEEKKRHAAMLRDVSFVPIDEGKPLDGDTDEELDQATRKKRSSSRRRRSRSSSRSSASRTARGRGSHSSSSGGAAVALGVIAAVIIVGGLLFALLG